MSAPEPFDVWLDHELPALVSGLVLLRDATTGVWTAEPAWDLDGDPPQVAIEGRGLTPSGAIRAAIESAPEWGQS